MCPASVAGCLRNFSRAGTLANRCSTVTVVPGGVPCGSRTSPPAAVRISQPTSSCAGRVSSETWATEEILASASPRNPSVVRWSRSSALLILLVAWRWNNADVSSAAIPQPSSCTRISRRPPSRTSTRISPAPASRLFSISSLTTDAGRSTTSPAAIWFATSAERTLIGIGTTPCAYCTIAPIVDARAGRESTVKRQTTNVTCARSVILSGPCRGATCAHERNDCHPGGRVPCFSWPGTSRRPKDLVTATDQIAPGVAVMGRASASAAATASACSASSAISALQIPCAATQNCGLHPGATLND